MTAFLMVVSNYPEIKKTFYTPYANRLQINRDSYMIGIWKIKNLKNPIK